MSGGTRDRCALRDVRGGCLDRCRGPLAAPPGAPSPRLASAGESSLRETVPAPVSPTVGSSRRAARLLPSALDPVHVPSGASAGPTESGGAIDTMAKRGLARIAKELKNLAASIDGTRGGASLATRRWVEQRGRAPRGPRTPELRDDHDRAEVPRGRVLHLALRSSYLPLPPPRKTPCPRSSSSPPTSRTCARCASWSTAPPTPSSREAASSLRSSFLQITR